LVAEAFGRSSKFMKKIGVLCAYFSIFTKNKFLKKLYFWQKRMHINIKFMGYLYKIVFLAKTHAYYSEKYFKMKSKKKFNLRERPREHRYSQSRVVVVEFCIGNGFNGDPNLTAPLAPVNH